MNQEQENKRIEDLYRTALYDMMTAMLRFLSVEDRQWLMPRLKTYTDACDKSAQR